LGSNLIKGVTKVSQASPILKYVALNSFYFIDFIDVSSLAGNVVWIRKKKKINTEGAALFTQRNAEGSFILDKNVSLLGRRGGNAYVKSLN